MSSNNYVPISKFKIQVNINIHHDSLIFRHHFFSYSRASGAKIAGPGPASGSTWSITCGMGAGSAGLYQIFFLAACQVV
ncbi:hypothetical protein RCL_jg1681.t1 [Rhizophagus clarus]|uniref:Uncharacterized protein n=1 Tax=Rhizophagus clarus TaxID=94130 RepID=A0A8H3L6X3_9GLOM|nr:hypothetical protein RCL_jg1681.t1 [Rhizophagus clarus]